VKLHRLALQETSEAPPLHRTQLMAGFHLRERQRQWVEERSLDFQF
jgi:hypothetical protein